MYMQVPVGTFVVDFDRVLGVGGFGKVYKGYDSRHNKEIACKSVRFGRTSKKQVLKVVLKEMRVLERVDSHDGCIQMRGAFPDPKSSAFFRFMKTTSSFFIFMDLASGGDLLDRVQEQQGLTESEAMRHFRAMVNAVHFLHDIGIAHRDLKLENFLLTASGECKLCDFGLAHEYDLCDGKPQFQLLHTQDKCGSKCYMAPELFTALRYDGRCADMWAMGICLFAMLSQKFPFEKADTSNPSYRKFVEANLALSPLKTGALTHLIFTISAAHLTASALCNGYPALPYRYRRARPFPDAAMDVVDALLTIDPRQRPAARDVLRFTWLEG